MNLHDQQGQLDSIPPQRQQRPPLSYDQSSPASNDQLQHCAGTGAAAAAAATTVESQLSDSAGKIDVAEGAVVGSGITPSPEQLPIGDSLYNSGSAINSVGHEHSKGSHEITNEYKKSPAKEGKPSVDPQAGVATAATGASNYVVGEAAIQARKVAWCELCSVECNSLDVLEQHRNGKRHKKNMARAEELKKASKLVPITQNHQGPQAGPQPDESQPGDNAAQVEGSQTTENLPAEIDRNSDNTAAEVQLNAAKHEENLADLSQSLQAKKQVENRSAGKKRKQKGGQEGKQAKKLKGSRPVPVWCELCNVCCDKQEVFDCHLSGRKHIAKLKQLKCGKVGLQALPPRKLGLQFLYPPSPTDRILLDSESQREPWTSAAPPGSSGPSVLGHHPSASERN